MTKIAPRLFGGRDRNCASPRKQAIHCQIIQIIMTVKGASIAFCAKDVYNTKYHI